MENKRAKKVLRSAMHQSPNWQEVDSKVYRPGLWLAFAAGALFVAAGVFISPIGGIYAPGIPSWFRMVMGGGFVLLGGPLLACSIIGICASRYVRHAAPHVLPNVPPNPVICEGSVVHRRLTHELYEDVRGWQFRPSERLWRNDKGLLFGFGIPFMVFFVAITTWSLHNLPQVGGWVAAAFWATCLTAICGGLVFLVIALVLRAGYRRLSWLTIPRNGSDLELDSPEEPNPEKVDLGEGLKWVFLGESKRQRLSIPRELVVAVQLCPWKYVVSSGEQRTTWAVQGLLVLASSKEAVNHRLPILLTSDFVGAARLMQRLAYALHVPYLFCADADGWRAEVMRAEGRPALRVGGIT